MKTYKPLPDCLTIKNSEIEGLGLFAAEDIPAGTNLGVSHVRAVDASQDNHEDYWERTPLGGFYNHSETPNCWKVLENGHYELVTTKDIKVGDEITVWYTLYSL